jgi:D-arabinose 1-dehydrogenase-like Zn-dependent alcohol dehydrogenase
MKAMILKEPRSLLVPAAVSDPAPGPHQLLIKVHACAVCRTDLHVIDGELLEPKLPLIPGHEIIGTVVAKGSAVERFAPGDRSPGWDGAAAPAPIAAPAVKTCATAPATPATRSTADTPN